jgi:hypothetical protein
VFIVLVRNSESLRDKPHKEAKRPLCSTNVPNLGLDHGFLTQNPRFFLLFTNAGQKYSTSDLADFFHQCFLFHIGRD